MKSFKKAAYKVLKNSEKPLHYKEITEKAMKKGLLSSKGKTPWATMNAVLSVDIKLNKNNSPFKKTAPATYTINPKYREPKKEGKKVKRTAISEEFVKNSTIIFLTEKGWKITRISGSKSKGVDIKAQKGNRYFFIEAKGVSDLRQTDETGFVYSLGQIVTRMKVPTARHAYNYGLALPSSSARIAVRRIPWKVSKLLTLYVFSVNRNGDVRKYSWKDFKKTVVLKSI